MKILIPTDFSKCANNAIQYGLEIAAKSGATVTLLNVLYPFEAVNNNVYQALWVEDYIKTRNVELKKVATRFSKKTEFSNIKIHEKVGIGFPVQEICQIAEDIKADLIIMGATGASDLAALFLGSNASGVITKTRIPVLIVPTKSKFQTMTTAVFPTDFDLKVSDRSLSALQTLLTAYSASLTMLHILSDEGGQPNISGEERVSKKLGGTSHYFHYLHNSNVPQAVNKFMESVHATLLISVSHDHSMLHRFFYESVSSTLAYRTRIPMLVLHDAK
jgi:nucleotide-binding universal stress UspA family protein